MFQSFCHMENLAVVTTIFWPFIVGNPCAVSILFSNGKSYRICNNFLALHCKQSIRCLKSFVRWEIEPLFEQFFWPSLIGNLSVVSIHLTDGKSNRCLNNLLAFYYSKSIRCLNQVLSHGKSHRYFNNFFALHCKQSIPFSILLSNGISNRCFNTLFALHCKQSIHRFNSLLKWKI